MTTLPDPAAVIRIIREVAAAEILPRFRNLAADDVGSKGSSPYDLVTVADIESEKRLSERLRALAPGSLVVGEEGAEADRGLLAALAGEAPVWVLDPVDGTVNFAHGRACFAVIVAWCLGGETAAGWIYDPVADAVLWSAAGEGVWFEDGKGRRAVCTSWAADIAAMTGSLTPRAAARLYRAQAQHGGISPAVVRYGCAGREYMDLATGAIDFAQYTRLKPWDHAAGVLIHREAGGFSALRGGGSPYRPEPGILEETLLLAPDEESWRTLDLLLR